ncbi:MAG: hypothetical protein AM324_015330 [Candidatus Thorarchaeota archaeon SMTZ1-83]
MVSDVISGCEPRKEKQYSHDAGHFIDGTSMRFKEGIRGYSIG